MKLKPIFALLMVAALTLGSLAPAAAAPALGEIFEGTVTAIDSEAGTLTLELEDGTSLVVIVPVGFDFTTILLGDTVRVNGEVQSDGSVLAEEIENETGEEIEAPLYSGTITGVDAAAGTVTIQLEDGSSLVLVMPEGFDFTTVLIGDSLVVAGTVQEDGSVLVEAVNPEVEEDGEEGETANSGAYCNGSQTGHPMAVKLAAAYGITEEWVMSYFCSGMGFGQIMLALMTAQSQGLDAESLLAARAEGEGWGQIWKGLGLTGRDRHNGDSEASEDGEDGEDDKPGGGPPDWAGGPPPWAGGGDKDDKPGGKPDKDKDNDD